MPYISYGVQAEFQVRPSTSGHYHVTMSYGGSVGYIFMSRDEAVELANQIIASVAEKDELNSLAVETMPQWVTEREAAE